MSLLGMLSPMCAVALGWLMLGQTLSPTQGLGAIVVLGSLWLGSVRPPENRSAIQSLTREPQPLHAARTLGVPCQR